MTDHTHDHFEIVEDWHLRMRVAHDAGDTHALKRVLDDAVSSRCRGCLGDLILMLLGGLPRLDYVDRSYAYERLCELHFPNIDQDATKALFKELHVTDELDLFGMEEGFPD
jgi:hypothetical protein